MPPHLRVVLPSATCGGRTEGGNPLDLEGELRRAAVRAIGGDVSGDLVEELSCVACEAIEGAARGREALAEELRSAIGPVLEEACVAEEARAAVLAAFLVVATEPACGEGSSQGQPLKTTACTAKASGGPKWQRRGDAERERAAEYLRERAEQVAKEDREEEDRLDELAKLYQGEVEPDPGDGSLPTGMPCALAPPATAEATGSTPAAGDREEDSSADEDDEASRRDREKTKKRLRQLGQPVTLFGESDEVRFARLTRCELSRDQDELAGGSMNVMQILDRRSERQMSSVLMRHTALAVCGSAEQSPPPTNDDDGMGVDWNRDADDPIGVESADEDADAVQEEEEADERARQVVVWLRTTLRDWEASLRDRGMADEANGSAAQLRVERAQFRQSKQYLKPLRRKLRSNEITPNIVVLLADIAGYCDKQQYREAKEAYMRLAIGNSAWPMGCTQVTFHDRPNRHLIGEASSAHVLDDETTRKYVQMVKRLLSFSETRHTPRPFLTA